MFDAVVFSGGGSRCFWQAGFCSTLTREGLLQPKEIAAVSAGAAMACVSITGDYDEAVDVFADMAAGNRKNFYPEHALKRAPIFPHAPMYQEALLSHFTPTRLSKIHSGPPLRVLLAVPPGPLGSRASAVLAFAVYKMERRLRGPVHPRWCRRLGFSPRIVAATDCADGAALTELILQSSCTPPFTPMLRRDRKPVLDGGAVDPVPVLALRDQHRSTLVLLTSRYPERAIPQDEQFCYVQPSRAIPVGAWDYTNPQGIIAAFALGQRDAEAWLTDRGR